MNVMHFEVRSLQGTCDYGEKNKLKRDRIQLLYRTNKKSVIVAALSLSEFFQMKVLEIWISKT